MKKSGVYQYRKKLFRYDYEHCVVEWIWKLSKEEKKENEEWRAKYGKDLYENDGAYSVLDSAGLRLENWKNKEVRNDYLDEWIYNIDEETRFMAEEFKEGK